MLNNINTKQQNKRARITLISAFSVSVILVIVYVLNRDDPKKAITGNIEAYKSALVGYFRPLNMLPIFVPSDQNIGDVFDPGQNWVLVSKGEECFADTETITPSSAQLPQVMTLNIAELTNALGMLNNQSVQINAKYRDQFALSFTEISKKTVSQRWLRKNLNTECSEELSLIIDASPMETEEYQPLAVVGSILYGKRKIIIQLDQGSSTNATISSIENLISSLGVDKDVSANESESHLNAAMNNAKSMMIIIEDKNAIPIAFMPAFMPQLIFNDTMGPKSTAGSEALGVEWTSFDANTDSGSKFIEGLGQSLLKSELQ